MLFFAFVIISGVSGYVVYQTLRPALNPATFDLNVMMGHPTVVSYTLANGTTRDGWYYPGLRGAPAVIVCHGYLSQRADVLTLVTTLQDHQFNVFLFDFTGNGASPGVTTLGYREADELRSAIQALAARDDVDPRHFGLWGVDMGGYAVLKVAATDPRIAAFAVDDAYNDPIDMLRMQVRKSGLTIIPGVLRFSEFGFRMLNFSFRREPSASAHLAQTSGIPKLFVESQDRPELAAETQKLFLMAPGPKQTLIDRLGYRDMADDDRKAYESQVVNFFLLNIPPTSGR
jgi:pimeloyl-ACP methyl ester carboxylesterase